MNAPAIVVSSVLAASAAAVGVNLAMTTGSSSAVEAPALAGVESQLEQLQQENEGLKKRLDGMSLGSSVQAQPASASRSAAAVVSPEQVAAAVEAYLSKRGEGASAAGGSATPKGFDMETELAGLIGSEYWSNSDAWRRAFDAGKMDEVVEAMEKMVEDSPNDIGAKLNLAGAYLAYLQMDNTKWSLSMKADQQYDAVLDIDENHWDARFSKAVSYTFWPDFLGKKKDAIGHFEKLVSQQASMPAEPEHAQSYLYLGNMLSERDPERAREIWQQGLQRHPGNSSLIEKLGND